MEAERKRLIGIVCRRRLLMRFREKWWGYHVVVEMYMTIGEFFFYRNSPWNTQLDACFKYSLECVAARAARRERKWVVAKLVTVQCALSDSLFARPRRKNLLVEMKIKKYGKSSTNWSYSHPKIHTYQSFRRNLIRYQANLSIAQVAFWRAGKSYLTHLSHQVFLVKNKCK